jgi:hypothetical protein
MLSAFTIIVSFIKGLSVMVSALCRKAARATICDLTSLGWGLTVNYGDEIDFEGRRGPWIARFVDDIMGGCIYGVWDGNLV